MVTPWITVEMQIMVQSKIMAPPQQLIGMVFKIQRINFQEWPVEVSI